MKPLKLYKKINQILQENRPNFTRKLLKFYILNLAQILQVLAQISQENSSNYTVSFLHYKFNLYMENKFSHEKLNFCMKSLIYTWKVSIYMKS